MNLNCLSIISQGAFFADIKLVLPFIRLLVPCYSTLYNFIMLSYLHAYHAGNHADILKHIILSETIRYMKKKDKPFTFFDTHSGNGLYNIDDEKALKTGEAKTGILRLLEEADENFSEILSIKNYLDLVRPFVMKREYPGSPFLEEILLRKDDVLHLSDLHPQVELNLRQNMKNLSQTLPECARYFVSKQNGFEMLNSLTPPKTKRGAVLIDPSYEELSDYSDVSDTVLKTFKKWTGGVILIWYPLLSYRMSVIENMVESITEGVHVISPNAEVNDFRLCVRDQAEHEETVLSETSTPRLFGSGMLVINTPWTLPEEMKKALPVLEKLLRTV